MSSYYQHRAPCVVFNIKHQEEPKEGERTNATTPNGKTPELDSCATVMAYKRDYKRVIYMNCCLDVLPLEAFTSLDTIKIGFRNEDSREHIGKFILQNVIRQSKSQRKREKREVEVLNNNNGKVESSPLLFVNLFCIYHYKCGSISDRGVLQHDTNRYPYQTHYLNVCLLVDCAWRVFVSSFIGANL
eukprot:354545_1